MDCYRWINGSVPVCRLDELHADLPGEAPCLLVGLCLRFDASRGGDFLCQVQQLRDHRLNPYSRLMKDCCKDLSQREEKHPRPDLVVSVCLTCGCRHFELTVETGEIGLEITPL